MKRAPRSALAALTVLAFALSCGAPTQAKKKDTVAPSDAVPPSGSNDAAIDQLAEKRIQDAIAKARNVAPGDVDVTIFDDVKVPGVSVFKARVGSGRRGAWSFGVLARGAVELDRDRAIAAVIRAWGYGASRTVPASDVAEVVGELLGSVEPSHPITTAKGSENVPDGWRARVALPKEIDHDGRPGVEFWVRMGRPPLARVRASFDADGTPHLEVIAIGDLDGAPGGG